MSEQKVWNIMACEMNYETWEESAISFVSSIFFFLLVNELQNKYKWVHVSSPVFKWINQIILMSLTCMKLNQMTNNEFVISISWENQPVYDTLFEELLYSRW